VSDRGDFSLGPFDYAEARVRELRGAPEELILDELRQALMALYEIVAWDSKPIVCLQTYEARRPHAVFDREKYPR
jgi:hypothetical protein